MHTVEAAVNGLARVSTLMTLITAPRPPARWAVRPAQSFAAAAGWGRTRNDRKQQARDHVELLDLLPQHRHLRVLDPAHNETQLQRPSPAVRCSKLFLARKEEATPAAPALPWVGTLTLGRTPSTYRWPSPSRRSPMRVASFFGYAGRSVSFATLVRASCIADRPPNDGRHARKTQLSQRPVLNSPC